MATPYILNHGTRAFARCGAVCAVIACAVLFVAGSACAQMVQWQSLTDAATPRLEDVETTFLHFTSRAFKESLRDGWREEYSSKLVEHKDCVWATSITAEMSLTVMRPRPLTLALTIRPHSVPAIGPQRVDVVWNGHNVGVCQFDEAGGWSFRRFALTVPPEIQKVGANTVAFFSRYALSAADVGRGGDKADAARCAFGFQALQLVDAGQEPLDVAAVTELPQQATSIATLDGHALTQQPGGWVKIPLLPPAAERLALRFAEAGSALASGAVVARWDTVEGGASRPLEFAQVVEGEKSWLEADLTPYAGQHLELIFDTTNNGPGESSSWVDLSLWLLNQAPAPAPAGENHALPPASKVVVVLLDALRADGLGCGGAPRPTSPFIDSVAQGAVQYDRVYSTASWTFPSVVSIFTGLFPPTHGVHWVDEALAVETPTLQETLKAAGIATGCVAESPFFDARYKLNRGFDFYESYWPDMGGERRSADITKKALEFMTAHKEERFFLYVHYFPPHVPYVKGNPLTQTMTHDMFNTMPIEEETRNKGVRLNQRVFPKEAVKHLRARYDENIRYADDQVRDLFAGMKELGLGEDTAIIIMSDHGESFQEHGRIGHSGIPYESQIRVPLIVQFGPEPKAPGANERRLTPVRTVDVFPTVCSWFGVAPPPSISGVSLTEARSYSDEAPITYAEAQSIPNFEAFVWDRYKLVRGPADAFELYDIELDPGELSNLYDMRPVLADYLRARATAWLDHLKAGAVNPATKAETSDEASENLKALGYLQ